MEVSALKHAGVAGSHGRSPLLRLQSDERLIALIRRGNHSAFEALVNRYQSRLLAFCRHMLGSREDAEDVLQEVFAAAFNAIVADERPINARPWLYRIARNRSLNHLRRAQPIGVDSMDVHLSEHGITTADKADRRETFRELIADVHELPETQRTALLLREIDALSYEQIAEAMETTIPSVKSLLVRARVSLAEAAEARLLSCDDVRHELGEIAEGLRHRTTPPVRRHLRACDRCGAFRSQLRATNKALALMLPVGPLLLAKRVFLTHLGLSAGAGAGGGTAATGTAALSAATAGTCSATTGGLLSAGIGTITSKAAAGLAAAALVTAGAVEIDKHKPIAPKTQPAQVAAAAPAPSPAPAIAQHSPPATPAAPAPARYVAARTEATAAARRDAPAEKPAQEQPAAPAETPAAAPEQEPQPAAQPPVAPGHTQTESSTTGLPAALPADPGPPVLIGPPPVTATPATAPPPTATVPPPATTPEPAPTEPAPVDPLPPVDPVPPETPPTDPPPPVTPPETWEPVPPGGTTPPAPPVTPPASPRAPAPDTPAPAQP